LNYKIYCEYSKENLIILLKGHGTLAVKADALKVDEIKMLIDKMISELGRLDIVFCNATGRINFYNIHRGEINNEN
jgi:hypothetical protein